MCNSNKLKNNIYTKKLTHFLKLYSHIVFYHSNSLNALRQCQQIVENGEKVLFLVNGARLKRLSAQENTLERGHGCSTSDSSEGGNRKKLNKVPGDHNSFSLDAHFSSGRNAHLISQLCAAGMAGNSFLVGCTSLSAMQKCIGECNSAKNSAYVCLGGIYENGYLDHCDCLRLARINLSHTAINLIHTMTAIQKRLLSTLQKPQQNLCRILGARGQKYGEPTHKAN